MREYKKVNGYISDDDAAEIVKAVEADFRMEGMAFTEPERRMLFAVAKGDISEEAAIRQVLAEAGVNNG